MKKLSLIILFTFITSIFLAGCVERKPFILMYTEPITQENAPYAKTQFKKNQRIYYALVNPKGFKDDTIKIEVVKRGTKVPIGNYSIQYAQDLKIDSSKKYYRDYIVLTGTGTFFVQFFELREPEKCIARYYFEVK